MTLFKPLILPNGTVITNRLGKASMEEGMADADQAPSEALIRLYQIWAQGQTGLILTGNVMVDRRAVTGAGAVVLENDQQLDKFKRWAAAATAHGAQVWMQINHPGRQMPSALGQETWAPSAVAMDLGGFSKKFFVPKEMTEADIAEVIRRFVKTAQLAEQSNFDGVEIHAAHGYLLSQFLSPISNKRQDQWGGPIENRARLLIDIVKAVRAAVAPTFAVAVKLNSADFQRGGFSAEDASRVVTMLNELGLDLIELSGGSYEAPAMQGETRDGRTLAREAYFLEFAKNIAKVARMPLMVTGGIRRRAVSEQVINSGIAMAGMATALAIEPNLPQLWKDGVDVSPVMRAVKFKDKMVNATAVMAMVKAQLNLLSQGRRSKPDISPFWTLISQQISTALRTRRYRRWVAKQAVP